MPFEVVWEIDPPVEGDVARLHRQLATLDGLATAALVPDNHTGRATVSSIAVAAEVQRWGGGRAIACINARDRNLLGFRRDLLTAAAYGVSGASRVGNTWYSGAGENSMPAADASATDPHLADHVFRGEPLFAAVLGLEAMAQTADDTPQGLERECLFGLSLEYALRDQRDGLLRELGGLMQIQVREHPGDVDGLAVTIAEHGLLQPLGVVAAGQAVHAGCVDGLTR